MALGEDNLKLSLLSRTHFWMQDKSVWFMLVSWGDCYTFYLQSYFLATWCPFFVQEKLVQLRKYPENKLILSESGKHLLIAEFIFHETHHEYASGIKVEKNETKLWFLLCVRDRKKFTIVITQGWRIKRTVTWLKNAAGPKNRIFNREAKRMSFVCYRYRPVANWRFIWLTA